MFNGTLKPYQVEAVEKMADKQKMLVAYEMGLGKTPMTIAAVESIVQTSPYNTYNTTVLILCLASLKYQWKAEIEKFSDSTAIVIDGTPKQRTSLYETYSEYDYIIMNYEQVVNDWETLRHMDFVAIVCDEATAIKGFRAKRAKKVKELAKKIPVRFALTGTPIENGRPEEIFSIMQFVDPAILGRFDLFDKTFIVRNHFGGVQRYRNLPTLYKTLAESTVRKSQKDPDVAPYLPDAVHRPPLLVPLDRAGKVLYNYIANDLRELLVEVSQLFGSGFSIEQHYGQGGSFDDPANEYRGQIMSRITALRMLCSNPSLLVSSAEEFSKQSGKGSAYINGLASEGLLDNLSKTPKLDATIAYLSDHLNIDETYKAVIFSSYLGSVDQIVECLAAKNFKAVAYTGRMNAKEKEEAKVSFQTTPEIRVLVSSDAGGYGVDLPQANLLVNYDQPWSAGLSVQRNGRINRTSSTWSTITIQDILIYGSIEQRQYDTLNQKKHVAGAVLDGKGINSKGGVDLTVGSLIEFLTSRIT
ncbi:HepA Superfamily II DNA/RNA helicases, SNF2 family [uncultured Caudovirales phage]|uniref:HepA Superfamily II DNA/RNA helicases, SNF2 family n=1 Tax=uncultured Caudovirales phage TaxID=2100421 RepID=A0A6J7WSF2_9CAUD|nr:HepA Superfamily II DNA/RNA helicases, SNF2 family [uncultured Caudovirales phage]